MNIVSYLVDQPPLTVPDREVRRLLRLLRKPKCLESHTLALAIRDHLKATNCYEAVLRFLNQTFNQYGQEGRRLHELLRRTDIDGSETHASIAASMNLSTRQFYRHRSNAIHIIVRALRELFSASKDEALSDILARSMEWINPRVAIELYSLNSEPAAVKTADLTRLRARLTSILESNGEADAARELAESIRSDLRFRNHEHRHDVLAELAYRDFLIGRYRSDRQACTEALSELRLNAVGGQRAEILAALCDAEMSLRFLNQPTALSKLRAAVSAARKQTDTSLLISAMLSLAGGLLYTGAFAEASRLVNTLELCASVVPTLNAESLALKNRLALSDPSIEPAAYDGRVRSFGEAMLAATWARHLLAQGQTKSGWDLASRTLEIAESRKYAAPVVWCLVTLGEMERACALSASCNDWALSFDALAEYNRKPAAERFAHPMAVMAGRPRTLSMRFEHVS